ncbi:transferase [Flavobacterium cyanobacteriorum]|uniref:Transferase n=1 Tax=Flavobacterium cyanobacteriorum TaxID=2022802 RepID=A0A255YUY7_9FLAO|nr:transferase [Flavobacterium cyanobacteriorum]OYQ33022.1 transferase [Flavobacterium cyanobacteriorum]
MRTLYHKLKFYRKVNWLKTLYFNFKKFNFLTALKLPVFFYGPVKFQNINGRIIINAPLKRGMIGFGQPYEKTTVHKGYAELAIEGTIIFNGHVQFGKDYFVYVAPDAVAEFGHMSSMASSGKIICTYKVILGDYARIGSESQILDTNFHTMINTLTGEKYSIKGPVHIGSFNYIGNRVSIMKDTVTPDYCSVASNSVCNKNYVSLGQNILIGGVPAALLKNNISRDWEREKELLLKWLIIKL